MAWTTYGHAFRFMQAHQGPAVTISAHQTIAAYDATVRSYRVATRRHCFRRRNARSTRLRRRYETLSSGRGTRRLAHRLRVAGHAGRRTVLVHPDGGAVQHGARAAATSSRPARDDPCADALPYASNRPAGETDDRPCSTDRSTVAGSRHGAPVRPIQQTPSKNRRLSLPVTPRSPGTSAKERFDTLPELVRDDRAVCGVHGASRSRWRSIVNAL